MSIHRMMVAAADRQAQRPADPGGVVVSPTALATLRIVSDLIEREGHSPSIREVSDARGTRSLSTTHVHLHALRRAGLVAWVDKRPRTLRVTKSGRDALGPA